MVTVKITYVNHATLTRTFVTQQQANWFIHNEGDHVSKVEYL